MPQSVPSPESGRTSDLCVVFESDPDGTLADLAPADFLYELISARERDADLAEIVLRPMSRTEVVLWLSPGADRVRVFASRIATAECGPTLRAVESTESLPAAVRRLGPDAVLKRLLGARPVALTDPSTPAGLAWTPHPVGILPEPIRSLVREVAAALGLDPAFVAVPALAILAGCIGNRRAVSAKDSWSEPAVLWAVVVAESGTGKSPALAALLRPLVKLDVAAIRTHRQAMRQHERDLATWKAQRGELPEAPKPPRRVVVMDTTAEAVGVRLDESPLGLLLARDELGAWFGGFDQYRSGRGADAQKWLEMYDARPVFVDRKGGPAIAIPRAAVSVAGCATPAVVAGGLLGSHEEDGMLPRMLLVKPPRTPARWTNRIVTPRIAAEYRHLVDGLLALTMAGDQDGAPEPHVVRLSEAALRRWIAWFDEAASRDVETVGFEAAVRAKSRAWALRFALVHHTCRHVHGDPNVREDEIDDASLHAGILLADWHVNESLRVREELAGKLRKPEDADLIAWMERRGGRASVRDVQRGGPKRLRGSADDAEAGLMRVVDAGWAEWDETPAAPTGGPAQRVAVLYVFLPVATGDTRLDFPEDPEPPSPVAAPPVDPSSPTPLAARASPEDVDEALGAVERAMVAGDAGAEQEAAGRLLRLVGASEAASLLAGLRPAAQRQPGTSAAGEGAL